MKHILSILIPMFLLLLAACSHPEPDAALSRAASVVDSRPEEAIAMLDSIDSGTLSDADRHFYDLLTVKANDKTFVTHESDSLILDILDYYSAVPQNPLYTETLYYAGRVYSDLGDYPTALRYYQQALDNPGHAPESDDLRSRLNTQTGMLLEQLRLYDQAIPYFEEVLNRKMQERDSAGIVYTLQRLGGIYYNSALQDVPDSVRCRNLDKADSLLTRSLDYSETLPGTFPAMSRVWLAGVSMEKGDSETALKLVRNTPEQVKPISRNFALAFASEVYLECGVLDSAYMYARQLIAGEDMTNKRSGYRLLLYPELRSLIHPDTLNQYYEDYRNILEG